MFGGNKFGLKYENTYKTASNIERPSTGKTAASLGVSQKKNSSNSFKTPFAAKILTSANEKISAMMESTQDKLKNTRIPREKPQNSIKQIDEEVKEASMKRTPLDEEYSPAITQSHHTVDSYDYEAHNLMEDSFERSFSPALNSARYDEKQDLERVIEENSQQEQDHHSNYADSRPSCADFKGNTQPNPLFDPSVVPLNTQSVYQPSRSSVISTSLMQEKESVRLSHVSQERSKFRANSVLSSRRGSQKHSQRDKTRRGVSKGLYEVGAVPKSVVPVIKSIEENAPLSEGQLSSQKLFNSLITKYPSKEHLIRAVLRFDGFNIVQNGCYKKIFENDANMLINAPTGSGKTYLFEMALLKHYLEFSLKSSKPQSNNLRRLQEEQPQNQIPKAPENVEVMEGFISTYEEVSKPHIKLPAKKISTPEFKAILVAPIKALVNEMCQAWKGLFRELNVIELTSDEWIDRETENSEIKKANILIMTPEKFNMLKRRPIDIENLFKGLNLLLIDELHILDDKERGPYLESALTRIKLLQSLNLGNVFEKKVRLICVSATFTNGEQLSKWLDVPQQNYLRFSDECRPVQISKYVFGYPNASSPFLFDRSLNFKLNDILTRFSGGKNCLIFCPTQNSAKKTAEDVIKHANSRAFVRNEQHLQDLSRQSANLTDISLKNCVINGVGYHSAGLDMHNRREIERLFRSGQLPVLCTTSTLAQGVNLPAYLVIIKGTKCYKGSDKGFDEYKTLEVLQMMGRAGRPQFEDSGICVIMTDYQMTGHYTDVKELKIELSSHYMSNIRDDVGSEISLGTVSTIDCAVNFFKMSFFYMRLVSGSQKIDPSTLPQELKNKVLSINVFCKEYMKSCLDDLCAMKLVLQEGDKFSPTLTLKEICKQNVSIDSLKDTLLAESTFPLTKENILNKISNSREFCQMTSKLNERKDLNELNQRIGYPLKKSACTPDRKVWVLLQAHIERLKIPNWELKAQANEITNSAIRILKCFVKLFLDRKDLFNFLACLEFLTCAKGRLANSAPIDVLKQVDGVDETSARHLVDRLGISTLYGLRTLSETTQKAIFKIKPVPLKCLPDFTLHIKLIRSGSKSPRLSLSVSIKEICDHLFHCSFYCVVANYDHIDCHRYFNLVNVLKKYKEKIGENPNPDNNQNEKEGNPVEESSPKLYLFDLYPKIYPCHLYICQDSYHGCIGEIPINCEEFLGGLHLEENPGEGFKESLYGLRPDSNGVSCQKSLQTLPASVNLARDKPLDGDTLIFTGQEEEVPEESIDKGNRTVCRNGPLLKTMDIPLPYFKASLKGPALSWTQGKTLPQNGYYFEQKNEGKNFNRKAGKKEAKKKGNDKKHKKSKLSKTTNEFVAESKITEFYPREKVQPLSLRPDELEDIEEELRQLELKQKARETSERNPILKPALSPPKAENQFEEELKVLEEIIQSAEKKTRFKDPVNLKEDSSQKENVPPRRGRPKMKIDRKGQSKNSETLLQTNSWQETSYGQSSFRKKYNLKKKPRPENGYSMSPERNPNLGRSFHLQDKSSILASKGPNGAPQSSLLSILYKNRPDLRGPSVLSQTSQGISQIKSNFSNQLKKPFGDLDKDKSCQGGWKETQLPGASGFKISEKLEDRRLTMPETPEVNFKRNDVTTVKNKINNNMKFKLNYMD